MIRYFILSFSLLLTLPAVAQQYRDAAFPGGLDSMIQYINRHIIIPDAATLTEKGTYARVNFEITSKGKITNIKAAPGDGADDVYTLAIINLLKGMPDFKPGIIGGSRATIDYSIG